MKHLLLAAMVVVSGFPAAAWQATITEQTLPGHPAPISDPITSAWSARYRPPASAWVTGEKSTFGKLYADTRYDVLVLPFQSSDFGLSRAIRSAMAAKVAAAFAEEGVRVADPYVLARVLGEGSRQFDIGSIYMFARAVGARSVVMGHVGHDGAGRMKIAIWEAARPDGIWNMTTLPRLRTLDIADVEISFEDPALEAFDGLLPRVMGFLGSSWQAPAQIDAALPARLPSTPLSVQELSGPLQQAFYLQLLGSLTPAAASRTRERYFERSLLALDRLKSDQPDRRALLARAYLHLGLRPAALQLLELPKTATEQALVAELNGNLTALESLIPRISSPQDRLLGLLAVQEMKAVYGTFEADAAAEEAASLPVPDSWKPLVSRKLIDPDYWQAPSNISIKQTLDSTFPLAGKNLDSLADGAKALGAGDLSFVESQLLASRHVQLMKEQNAEVWCCEPFSYAPSARDYLEYLEAVAVDNLVRRAYLMATLQGRPAAAIAFLDETDTVFYEHPQFSAARAYAEVSLSEAATAEDAARLRVSAFKHAANAYFWSQGQTPESAIAFHVLSRGGVQVSEYGHVDNTYAGDLPYDPDYPLGTPRPANVSATYGRPLTGADQVERLLAFSRTGFDALTGALAYADGDQRAAVEQALSERFQGAPNREQWLAGRTLESGQVDDAREQMRDVISAQPRQWDLYQDLAQTFVEEGRLPEAAEVLEKYPPFADGQGNRVAISNHAEHAGSLLYWRGDLDRARPFYRVASELIETGSEASMTSTIRLALMEGDLRVAVPLSLERANRYQSRYAYRDYISMLFMLGYTDIAWQAFDALAASDDRPQLWEAAFCGHRRTPMAAEALIAWTSRPDFHRSMASTRFVDLLVLRLMLLDRVPDEQSLETLRQVLDDVRIYEDANGLGGVIPEGIAALPDWEVTTLEPPGLLHAKAIRSLHEGRYDQAWVELHTAVRNSRLMALGPYPYGWRHMALAARTTQQRAELEQVLAEFADRPTFEYWLARATIAGLDGDGATAREALDHALGAIRHPGWEVLLPAYEYAETLDWLWRETGSSEYRDRALQWVRSWQKIQPWHAWPYAMELALSPSSDDLGPVLEKAVYLDRNSWYLSRVLDSSNPRSDHAESPPSPFLRELELADGSAM